MINKITILTVKSAKPCTSTKNSHPWEMLSSLWISYFESHNLKSFKVCQIRQLKRRTLHIKYTVLVSVYDIMKPICSIKALTWNNRVSNQEVGLWRDLLERKLRLYVHEAFSICDIHIHAVIKLCSTASLHHKKTN